MCKYDLLKLLSIVFLLNSTQLKDSCDILVLRISSQIAELTAAIPRGMSIEQHSELTDQASDLNNMLFVEYRAMCQQLRHAVPPDEVDDLKDAQDAVLREGIPKVEKKITDLRAKTPGAAPAPAAVGGGLVHPVNPPVAPTPRKQTIKMKPLESRCSIL